MIEILLSIDKLSHILTHIPWLWLALAHMVKGEGVGGMGTQVTAENIIMEGKILGSSAS